ncbi:MAG: exodeoxyribonuclease VII small subunit [Kiritimatiellia bacterium]|jgi:exodeoxyribonuclease VII small subunit
MPEKKNAEPSFETALEQLETLVRQLESGTMGLDEMVASFERGQKLVSLCTAKLDEVEKKIEVLVKSASGELSTKPLDAGPAS